MMPTYQIYFQGYGYVEIEAASAADAEELFYDIPESSLVFEELGPEDIEELEDA